MNSFEYFLFIDWIYPSSLRFAPAHRIYWIFCHSLFPDETKNTQLPSARQLLNLQFYIYHLNR